MPPKKKTIIRQYLLTYSKANATKFITRKTFVVAAVNSFILSGKVTVRQKHLQAALSYACQVMELRCGTLLKPTSCQTIK